LPQGGIGTRHRVKKTAAGATIAAKGQFAMKTVADVIGVSRSNLIERLRERPQHKRIGRPPLPDDLVLCINLSGYAASAVAPFHG
jgi:hypothetical protein